MKGINVCHNFLTKERMISILLKAKFTLSMKYFQFVHIFSSESETDTLIQAKTDNVLVVSVSQRVIVLPNHVRVFSVKISLVLDLFLQYFKSVSEH